MAHCNDQDDETVILNRRNDAVVPDAVAPQSLKVPGQRTTKPARILGGGNALTQIGQNESLRFVAKLA